MAISGSFGTASSDRLSTCCDELKLIAPQACAIFNHSIIYGHRTPAQQFLLFEQGLSKCDGYTVLSDHNQDPSDALDFAPWHSQWGALFLGYKKDHLVKYDKIAKYYKLEGNSQQKRAKVMQWIYGMYCRIWQTYHVLGRQEGITFLWGGDWNQDGYSIDTKFLDIGHIGVVR